MNISIIIPVYNVELYVACCVKSVMNQTYTDGVECIIVNDCTPDRSMEIVEELVERYDGPIQFRLLYHEYNRGLAAARNTGIEAASGEWIYFLDSDDQILPFAFEKLYSLAEKYNPDYVLSNHEKIEQEVSTTFMTNIDKELLIEDDSFSIVDYFCKGYISPSACNKLLKKKFLLKNNILFKEGIYGEDSLWSFLLSVKTTKMAVNHSTTYLYVIRDNSIMTNKKKTHLQKYAKDNVVRILEFNKIASLLKICEIPSFQERMESELLIAMKYIEYAELSITDKICYYRTMYDSMPLNSWKQVCKIKRSLKDEIIMLYRIMPVPMAIWYFHFLYNIDRFLKTKFKCIIF